MKEEVPQNIEEGQLEQSSTVEDAPSPDVEGIREDIKEDTHEQIEGLHQEVETQAPQEEGQAEQKPEKPEEAKEKLISDISAKDYFEKFIKPKLEATVNALGLNAVIDQSKAALSQVDSNNVKAKVKAEKKAVRELSKAINATEFKKWSFTPQAMIDTKACNCSGAALVFAYVMNEHLGIQTKQANPSGHAVNVVYYSDQSNEYVDPRNNSFYNIDLSPENLETSVEGYDVYKVNKWGLEFKKLPIINYQEGAANTLLNNTVWMDKDKEKDPEAMEALAKYADSEKLAFAQHFTSSKFLETRKHDEAWLSEEKSVKRRRVLQKIPLIGRFF